MSVPYTSNTPILDGVTSTTTSEAFDVSKRQQLSIQFVATVVSGSGSSQVQISNDDVNFVNYGSPVVQSATGSVFFFKEDPQDYFRSIRIVNTISGNGSYSAMLQAG